MFSSPHKQMDPFGMPRPIMTVDRQRWMPNVEIAPNCPRCDSSNTKFCYYNNYSLTQPRYFCKGCRRYWTKGGSLRNIPVGGGTRKNRRGKTVRLSSRAGDGNRKSSSGALRPDLALDDMVGGSHQSLGGESIDLAVLYSKFLNPEAEREEGRLAPELAEMVGLTSSERLVGLSEMSYSFDDVSAFESDLGTPVVTWQAPEIPEGLCPFPEVLMGHHCHHHDHWNSLDQSSFGAF